MAYEVIKNIRGRRYRYLQRSWREGKKVKTSAICLGAVGGVLGAFGGSRRKKTPEQIKAEETQRDFARSMATLLRECEADDQKQRAAFGETGAERRSRESQEHIDQLHEEFGMKMPGDTPTDTEE